MTRLTAVTRMGHDSERAALIYQHEARGADQRITDAIDFHVQAEHDDQGDDDGDGPTGALVPLANCTLIARRVATIVKQQGPGSWAVVLTWAFGLERVTGIEPALSAWEAANVLRPTTPVGVCNQEIRHLGPLRRLFG
jgi:hypothetical protein